MLIFWILRSIKQETYRLLLSFYLLIDKEIFIGQVLKKALEKNISLSSPIPASIAGLNDFYYHCCDSFTDHNKNEEITHKFLLSHSVPEYIKLTNVFYIPSHRCLYSADGKRIDISFANSRRNEIPTQIDIPTNFEDISTEFLYIGMLEMLHYGHFLIEGISHLWGLKDYSHYPLLYSGYIWTPKTLFSSRKGHLYIDNFLRLIGIQREKLLIKDTKSKNTNFFPANLFFKK